MVACDSTRRAHCNPTPEHFRLECVKRRDIITEAMRLLALRRNRQLTSGAEKGDSLQGRYREVVEDDAR